ncbi:MAG: hypothetical protein V7L27_01955 [Nostoc sp.]|uniref:hypothetical protein n=1 Tax=Nostoc sp. TaxID=1180 RepID=UPI002FFB283F
MSKKFIKTPIFCHTQRVRFLGGEGLVKSYKSESESWIYLIEMPLGLEPHFCRVGVETMVLLHEADLRAA